MSGIRIHINEEVIKRFTSEGLSLDIMGSVMFILLAMYSEQFELLDAFDDRNTAKRSMMLYQTLHRKGFLEVSDGDTLYDLTEKGVELANFLNSFDEGITREDRSVGEVTTPTNSEDTRATDNSSEVTIPSFSVNAQTDEEGINGWIEEWVRLFPSDKIQGRYLRTGKHECADRMRWFIKEYDYPKDVIFRATKAYLESQEMGPSGHTYTRNSSYFIFKGRSKHDRTSDLATWCQRVLDGDVEDKEYIERDAL